LRGIHIRRVHVQCFIRPVQWGHNWTRHRRASLHLRGHRQGACEAHHGEPGANDRTEAVSIALRRGIIEV